MHELGQRQQPGECGDEVHHQIWKEQWVGGVRKRSDLESGKDGGAGGVRRLAGVPPLATGPDSVPYFRCSGK